MRSVDWKVNHEWPNISPLKTLIVKKYHMKYILYRWKRLRRADALHVLCHGLGVSNQAWTWLHPEYLIIRTNTARMVRKKQKNVVIRDYSCWVERQWINVIWPFQKAPRQLCLHTVYVCDCVQYPFEFTLSGFSGLQCNRNWTGLRVWGAGGDWGREDCWKVFPLINRPRSLWLNVVTAGAHTRSSVARPCPITSYQQPRVITAI